MNFGERAILAALLFFALPAAAATGQLESPAQATTVSGIAVARGWHCEAQKIELEFDNAKTYVAAYGTERPDTVGICGKANTGFALLINWALLGPGNHSVRALADGVEFGRTNFAVVTFGAEYLINRMGETVVTDFPAPGESVVLRWLEDQQSFGVREWRRSSPSLEGRWNGADLEKRSNCTRPESNGNHGTYAEYNFAMSGSGIGITQTTVTGLDCSYTGSYALQGNKPQAQGRLMCSDGKQGTWISRDIMIAEHEMSLHLDIQLDTTESCTIEAVIGGSRLF